MIELSSGIRASLMQASSSKHTWLCLPGGPGLGSESIKDLLLILDIDANIYRVDLPDDGGNRFGQPISLSRWQHAILELTQQFESVIWLGHSFGGMLLQTIPQLESLSEGLILLNTAPDNAWFLTFSERSVKSGLPNLSLIRKNFLAEPSDETYKAFMLNSLSYYFTPKGMTQGLSLFQSLPFNHSAYLWALEHFHPYYQAGWIPKIPCLIISSELDHMTPNNLFAIPPYQTNNFTHVEVSQAGHFPWIEKPEDIAACLSTFYRQFQD